jgi:hypothetical protein
MAARYETEINSWLDHDGAVLVRVEFFDEAGKLKQTLDDAVVALFRMDADKLGYYAIGEERPHAFKIHAVSKEMDEWRFEVNNATIVVSQLWLKGQFEKRREWRGPFPWETTALEEVYSAL